MRQAGGRRKKQARTGLAMLVLAALLAGCGRGEQEPVIAERQETAAQEKETGASYEAAWVQMAATERYEAELSGEGFLLQADAPVKAPKAERLWEREIEAVSYQAEEMEAMKAAMAGALGTVWSQEEGFGESPGRETSGRETQKGGDYILSCNTGEEGGRPLFWVSHTGERDWNFEGFSSSVLTGFVMTEEERDGAEAAIEEKAEGLLETLGFGDYVFQKSSWKALAFGGDGKKPQPAGEYGLRMTYVPGVDGVPLARSGDPAYQGSYAEILYAADGRLLELKVVGRIRVGEKKEEIGFLLPFGSVTQVFEQSVQEREIGREKDGPETCQVRVSRVCLEYCPKWDGGEMEGVKGRAVPVWNFYGAAGQEENERLLLSVDAGDGSVVRAMQMQEG